MKPVPFSIRRKGGIWAKAALGMIFISGALFSLKAAPHPDASATLVVYNKNEPRSEEVARYYALKRGIPKENLCALECPNREEITRAEYQREILMPIRQFVQEKDLLRYGDVTSLDGQIQMLAATSNRLKYIVLCYGMPLKIAHNPDEIIPEQFKNEPSPVLTNAAAVDSELANLPTPQQPIVGFLQNPFYDKTFASLKMWNRRLLCVARLDGPTAGVALRLIDDAVETERLGLYGRALFDLRGIPESKPSHKLGDDWIRRAFNLFKSSGWETILDEKEEVFAEDVNACQCAIYAGWYSAQISGPFRRPDFRFRRGAVAYHIYSWSAVSLRAEANKENANWTASLLARGAAATMGSTYEPYLQMTPNVGILFQRLMEGCSFGEAAYSSQEFLSWMTTVVGDPLYRPFGISNEERISQLESRYDSLNEEEKTALAWGYRLKARQKYLEGEKEEGLQLAKEQAARLRRRCLWIGLANLYRLDGQTQHAEKAVKEAASCPRENSGGKTEEPLL